MEAILDRVHKLLALATSPNVHEAAAAAARAQALIDAHRLHDLLAGDPDDDPITDGAEAPLEVARKLRKWRIALASELAALHGCVAYTASTDDGEAIRLAGRADDREAVRALWGWLVDRIQWLSATEGAGRPRWWHDAFRVGAVDTIVTRLRLAREHARADLDERALILLDPALTARAAAVERFAADQLRLKPGRGLRVDARAYDAGRRAADAVPLAPGRRR